MYDVYGNFGGIDLIDSLNDDGFRPIPFHCPYPSYEILVKKHIVPNLTICSNCCFCDGFGIVCCDKVKLIPDMNYYQLPSIDDLYPGEDDFLLNIFNSLLGRV